ncbi:hypothetical protein B0H14DRAFT_3649120 [Mycena olivaceomarginata]|nr:hypothetical protein B0H14DRAFT_3649120 [Mycena olivaceomarginata]
MVPNANFAPQGGSAFSSGPSGSAEQPGASTSFSATERTMFGSRTESVASSSQRGRSPLRGSTAAPHSFRNVADLRQKDIRAAMRTSAPFHPAMKSQMDADLNRAGAKSSKKRKRRDDPSPSQERNVKPKVAPAKPYVGIVIPFTKEINRGHCSVPAAHLLVRLDDAGYVKDILISPDDTGEDIRTKILIAFSDIEPLVKYGFRLLFVHRKMKRDRHGNMVPKPGVPRILRTGKRELDFTAIKRALSDSSVRLSGPRFKRIIFLAVNPAGPNLPLRGFAYDKGDDLDHDLSSDELSQSSESGAEASDTTMDDVDDAKSYDQMAEAESTKKESELSQGPDTAYEPPRSPHAGLWLDRALSGRKHIEAGAASAARALNAMIAVVHSTWRLCPQLIRDLVRSTILPPSRADYGVACFLPLPGNFFRLKML